MGINHCKNYNIYIHAHTQRDPIYLCGLCFFLNLGWQKQQTTLVLVTRHLIESCEYTHKTNWTR